MYLNFKHFSCVVIVIFLMVFSVGAASGSEESTVLLEQANDLYYNQSNATASLPYYQQAEDLGNALAKAQIAKMLYLGAGVDEDKNLAKAWFKQVLPQLESAAQQGDAFAQYLYGYYWGEGFTGFKSDSKTIYWYQQAAEQGSAPAQFNLAGRYKEANGVAKDLEKSIYWYKKAAYQGNVNAQEKLGSIYYSGVINDSGNPIREDYYEAELWFEKAVANGSTWAQEELAALQEELAQAKIYLQNMKIVADFYNSDVDPDNWSYTTQNKYCSAASETVSSGLYVLKEVRFLSREEKHAITNNSAYALGLLKEYCE